MIKTNLDITWQKNKSLADLDNLPNPDVLATEIVENIEAGLESFREIEFVEEVINHLHFLKKEPSLDKL